MKKINEYVIIENSEDFDQHFNIAFNTLINREIKIDNTKITVSNKNNIVFPLYLKEDKDLFTNILFYKNVSKKEIQNIVHNYIDELEEILNLVYSN